MQEIISVKLKAFSVISIDIIVYFELVYCYTVAQKGHTCKLKMLLQTKNLTCKLKMLLQIKNSTCKLKLYMQTKTITNMKHEWSDYCKARSHVSDQVVITHTARAGLFIFNLQHNF